MHFVGIDLAWSYRNPSAVVVLEGERAVAWNEKIGSDEEIIAFLREVLGEKPALVAVDAPLVVPNERGLRSCDRELGAAFRRYEAAPHPANRLRFGGRVRGEELVKKLEQDGFIHSPLIEPLRETKQVVEVYPHPAAVTLFGLERTLKYKARPGRSLDFRKAELKRFMSLLKGLEKAFPALHAPAILNKDISPLNGRELKAFEDLVDALFCAYIALYCWTWGPQRYRVFGSKAEGYIIVPTP
jgi:predicted RNase H-like nuclease